MATWIDDAGRLREPKDGRHQFLRHIPAECLDPWLSYDSWDVELAIKLITIGYNIDIERYWDEAKNWPEGSTGLDSGRAYIDVYSRGRSIAESSIAASLLQNPDTPANWLAWAKRKGYEVSHLTIEQVDTKPQAAQILPVDTVPAPVVAASSTKPWMLNDPKDPAPAQLWYTPARYFARQLAIEKPTLLSNRVLLAEKVSTSLFSAGFKKRGGKLKFDSGTVLKALSNVTLG